METRDRFQAFDGRILDGAGLNRQAVFNMEDLPADIAQSIRNNCTECGFPCRQLILIGHGGRKLWESVNNSGSDSENPIDDFTVQTVKRWFATCLPQNDYRIIYPGSQQVGLQKLGRLAGWHHASPFMVGIDREWGSWYAYRALVAADTAFEPSLPLEGGSPCDGCSHRVCISGCPGAALADGRFDLGKCIAYRRLAGSKCRATCLARIACPVGSAHRYCDEQIRHSYAISMQAIEGRY